MCGRFTVTDPARLKKAYGRRFRFEEFSQTRLPARFNVAPTQLVLAVRNDGRDAAEEMAWGIDGRINARAETVAARAQRDRCIIFADGFYEWSNKRPTFFALRDRAPFAFAGIWQARDDAGACAVITCEPNALVRTIHDRMPVILSDDALDVWLGEGALPPEVARASLRPYPADAMIAVPASTRLNNAAYDAPDVLADDDPRQQAFDLDGI